uniref:Secreted protein n=1 Tax=Physcomitrium patens TaxID=3218 RepID=A0A2K1KQ72_PHYPA|nr:hypothetical protein PHYPA_006817 [Physcomitrium patens]
MAGFCIAVTILLLVARHVQDTHFLFLSTRETRQSAATLSFADVTTTASNTGAGQEQVVGKTCTSLGNCLDSHGGSGLDKCDHFKF